MHENIDDKVNEDELYDLDNKTIDEKKWHKNVFENWLKTIYNIKRPNGMNCICYNDEDELYNLDNKKIDEKKWHKNAFENWLKTIYNMKRPNGMNII